MPRCRLRRSANALVKGGFGDDAFCAAFNDDLEARLARDEKAEAAESEAEGEKRAGRSGRLGKVFVFFSNRLGCAGSLLVTVVLSALLFVLMRGCSGPPNVF